MESRTENQDPSTAIGSLLVVGPAIFNPIFAEIAKAAESTTSINHYAQTLGWPAPFTRTLRLAAQAFIKKPEEVKKLLDGTMEMRPADASFTFDHRIDTFARSVQISREFKFGGIVDDRRHWPLLLSEFRVERPDGDITSFDYKGEPFSSTRVDLKDPTAWKWDERDWIEAKDNYGVAGAPDVVVRVGEAANFLSAGCTMVKTPDINVWSRTFKQRQRDGIPTFHKAVYLEKPRPANLANEKIRIEVRHDLGPNCQALNRGNEFGSMEYECAISLLDNSVVRLIVPYRISRHDLCARMVAQDRRPIHLERDGSAAGIPIDEEKALETMGKLLTLYNRCQKTGMVYLKDVAGLQLLLTPPDQLSDLLTKTT